MDAQKLYEALRTTLPLAERFLSANRFMAPGEHERQLAALAKARVVFYESSDAALKQLDRRAV